jgi:hypothetical protein
MRRAIAAVLLLAGCELPPPPAPPVVPAPPGRLLAIIPDGVQAERITFSLDGSTVAYVAKERRGDSLVVGDRKGRSFGLI